VNRQKKIGLNLLHAILSNRWKTLTKSEKAVMFVLLIRSGNRLQCYPSVAEIAEGCGLESHSIHSALRVLEERRHIVVWRKEGCRNHYGVSMWIDPDKPMQKST